MEDKKESRIDRGCENGDFIENEVTISTSGSGIYFISKADGEERDSMESVVVSWGSQ